MLGMRGLWQPGTEGARVARRVPGSHRWLPAKLASQGPLGELARAPVSDDRHRHAASEHRPPAVRATRSCGLSSTARTRHLKPGSDAFRAPPAPQRHLIQDIRPGQSATQECTPEPPAGTVPGMEVVPASRPGRAAGATTGNVCAAGEFLLREWKARRAPAMRWSPLEGERPGKHANASLQDHDRLAVPPKKRPPYSRGGG